ncbi:hypothetical protein LOD99_8731 [Oopsacas minuta]|uniref:Uncharacterized protein n=1 Tax=Oopsacas minuta TaxID=111878 RepID=A0AAV7JGI2_9METZ|nr:hypothetical protein LOD99_8731 [Oopsacas minuta]
MSDQECKEPEASVREGDLNPKCINSGNPVFTCSTAQTDSPAPSEVQVTLPTTSAKPNPFYQTTSTTYGLTQPNDEMLPLTYHGKSNKFSEHLMNAGMYRNNSLNTATDKSPV